MSGEKEYYIENADGLYGISNENMIRDSLSYILKEYPNYIEDIREKNEELENSNFKLKDYPDNYKSLYYFIREVFPNFLKNHINDDNFYYGGSENISGNPPFVPWISINLYENNQNGYYIVYLFRSDCKGVYLSLALAAKQYEKKDKNIGVDRDNFRNLLNYYYDEVETDFDLNDFDDKISLMCKERWPNGKCDRPKDYENGTIVCKYYSFESELPDENTLENDLSNLISLYEFCEEFQIFNKIFDNNYSFELEKVIYQQYLILKKLSNLEINDEIASDNHLHISLKDFENNFNEFSDLIVSKRYKHKFLKYFNFLEDERLIELNILYNRVSNNLKNGLYIYILIDLTQKHMEFGLTQCFDKFSAELGENSFINLYKYLNDYFKNIDDINLKISENKLVLESINFDDLDQICLLNSYKNLIRIYEHAIPYYICFIYNKVILNNEFLGDVDASNQKNSLNKFNNELNLTFHDLSKKLEEENLKIHSSTIRKICASLNSGKNIIFNGSPGTGKTQLAKSISEVAENKYIDGYILTTATSDWSTFDTIGGLMPNDKGNLIFKEGKFLQAIRQNKWLIIDEINRADIDKAFGQLFTILSGNDINVELPFEDENGNQITIKKWNQYYSKHDENNAIYYIGKNWRIIGTMNNDDKDTLFDLSYAFMRRFMFIDIKIPSSEDFNSLMNIWLEHLSNKNMEEYKEKLIEIYSIESKPKDFGPAIFKDMLEYINERVKVDKEDDINVILNESIDSYIIPQLEGLNPDDIDDMKKELNKIFNVDEEINKKLEMISLNF